MMILILLLGLSFSAFAQDGLVIVPIGEAGLEREAIAIDQSFKLNQLSPSQKKWQASFLTTVSNDLMFYRKYFELKNHFLQRSSPRQKFGNPSFSYWSSKDIDYLFQTQIGKKKKESFMMNLELFSINTKRKTLRLSVEIGAQSYRKIAHEVASAIYQKITGKNAIFNSQIVFVSDKSSYRNRIRKELYLMDFDGANVKQLTFHGETVISPAISPDRKKIIYSLISRRGKTKNVDLYLYNLETKKTTLISKRKGLNSGAVFFPDGKNILLTLSFRGGADIYQLNLKSRNIRRVTSHPSDDVDPSLNSRGNLMAFLSGRPGKAMIYSANPQGTERSVKRISFVGKFNATPRFNPDGTEIAFSSWLDERFDIFRMNTDGNELVRLTKDFGSNEGPTYSPDGLFIAFSSQRVLSAKKAIQNIYIMDRDGDILGPVIENFGNCLSPRWSK